MPRTRQDTLLLYVTLPFLCSMWGRKSTDLEFISLLSLSILHPLPSSLLVKKVEDVRLRMYATCLASILSSHFIFSLLSYPCPSLAILYLSLSFSSPPLSFSLPFPPSLSLFLSVPSPLLHPSPSSSPFPPSFQHYASRSGHVVMCKLLLLSGAEVNVQTRGGGSTSLHRAAYCGHGDVVTVLVTAGADGKMVDGDGKTPLHKVCLQMTHFQTYLFRTQFFFLTACLITPSHSLTFPLSSSLPPQACEGGHVHVARQLLDIFPATAAVRDSNCRLPQDLVSSSGGQWSQLWEMC